MMDIAFDTTWCPVCSRQILPKRILVPAAPPTNAPTTPAPPPSATSQPKTDAPQARITRTKTGTIRAARGGGLVHGTGRVKPNGTIKRPSPRDSQPAAAKKAAAPPPSTASTATTPTAPVRQRTVIDQTPVPLYCSDECRLVDLQNSRGIDINYNPERHASPPLPPVPPNSASDVSPNEESDSSVGSSLGSDGSSVPSTLSHNGPPSPTTSTSSDKDARIPDYPIPKAYAALASIYDLPPCPPPPPLLRSDTSSSSDSDRYDNDYQMGLIMAGRRINDALAPRPEPKKRPSWSTPSAMLSTAYALNAQKKPQTIPGWTDGSDKWRASVYSFAAPSNGEDKSGREEESIMRAYTYKGVASTPLRSTGVYSTLGEQRTPTTPSANAAAYNAGPQMARARSEAEELYSKFDFSFARRSESRTSLAHQYQQQLSTSPTGSTRSLPATSASYRRKEVPILKKGAEGKLLVPDVKMRRVDSTSSCASSYTGTSTTASGSVYGGRRRSPLSRQGSECSVAEADERDVTIRAASVPQVRSWSYKDEYTYPIMTLMKKEKRIERRIVNGQEREVEVEVEVAPERKRLFLFPGKSSQL